MKFNKLYLTKLQEYNTSGSGGVFGDHGDDGYGDKDDSRPIVPAEAVIGSKKVKPRKKKKKKVKSVGENGRIAYSKGPVQPGTSLSIPIIRRPQVAGTLRPA